MKTKLYILTIVLALVINNSIFADGALSQSEISQILQTLTAQSKEAWISSGTISATHEEYKAAKTTDAEEINQLIEEAQEEYLGDTDKPEVSSELQQMKYDAIPFNIRYEHSNEYTMISNEVVKVDGTKFYWETTVVSRDDSVKPPADTTFMYDYFNI
ncbi:MAG: hypothetical protein JRJ39_06540, partial [Deltaproteobacteria bacterium]|nr:hypothetical protein [Deltaproteobacteria bacterium]